ASECTLSQMPTFSPVWLKASDSQAHVSQSRNRVGAMRLASSALSFDVHDPCAPVSSSGSWLFCSSCAGDDGIEDRRVLPVVVPETEFIVVCGEIAFGEVMERA